VFFTDIYNTLPTNALTDDDDDDDDALRHRNSYDFCKKLVSIKYMAHLLAMYCKYWGIRGSDA